MCIAPMKSMTAAQKGKTALNSDGVHAEIVSLDPMLTKNGCAYGLSFNCTDKEKSVRILKTKKIAHGEIIGGDL